MAEESQEILGVPASEAKGSTYQISASNGYFMAHGMQQQQQPGAQPETEPGVQETPAAKGSGAQRVEDARVEAQLDPVANSGNLDARWTAPDGGQWEVMLDSWSIPSQPNVDFQIVRLTDVSIAQPTARTERPAGAEGEMVASDAEIAAAPAGALRITGGAERLQDDAVVANAFVLPHHGAQAGGQEGAGGETLTTPVGQMLGTAPPLHVLVGGVGTATVKHDGNDVPGYTAYIAVTDSAQKAGGAKEGQAQEASKEASVMAHILLVKSGGEQMMGEESGGQAGTEATQAPKWIAVSFPSVRLTIMPAAEQAAAEQQPGEEPVAGEPTVEERGETGLIEELFRSP